MIFTNFSEWTFKAPIKEDTITTLPFGVSNGKNCFIKSIVEFTFVRSVFLASYSEGIVYP